MRGVSLQYILRPSGGNVPLDGFMRFRSKLIISEGGMI